MTEEQAIKLADLVDPSKCITSSLPKYAGGYQMGGNAYNTKFMLLENPCWLHRNMVKLLLGWTWVDNK